MRDNVSNTVRRSVETLRVALKLSYRFLNDGAHDRDVRATYLFPTDQPHRSIMSAIPLKDFIPGDYTLLITVTDEVAAQSATAQANFRVR